MDTLDKPLYFHWSARDISIFFRIKALFLKWENANQKTQILSGGSEIGHNGKDCCPVHMTERNMRH